LSQSTVLDFELSRLKPDIGKVLFETDDLPLLLFVDPSEPGDFFCLFSGPLRLSLPAAKQNRRHNSHRRLEPTHLSKP
jgi:hypothetical protein